MSSFKADSYYEAHADYDTKDPEYRDEDSAESEIPQRTKRRRAEWVNENYEALADLYQCFKGSGSVLFGGSFYQLGTMHQFCDFVFKYTMPGGTQ